MLIYFILLVKFTPKVVKFSNMLACQTINPLSATRKLPTTNRALCRLGIRIPSARAAVD